jgi:hypothetical protein
MLFYQDWILVEIVGEVENKRGAQLMHGPNEKLGLRMGQSQRHNQKMSNFHFDLSLKLSQGEVNDFSG